MSRKQDPKDGGTTDVLVTVEDGYRDILPEASKRLARFRSQRRANGHGRGGAHQRADDQTIRVIDYSRAIRRRRFRLTPQHRTGVAVWSRGNKTDNRPRASLDIPTFDIVTPGIPARARSTVCAHVDV